MIRFVDLTPCYWADEDDPENEPVCAFLDTVTDRFVDVGNGHMLFGLRDFDWIVDAKLRDRCLGLLPDSFFDRRPLIISRRVISKPGAALKVTVLEPSEEAERMLTVSHEAWEAMFPPRRHGFWERLTTWIGRLT